MIKNFFVKYWKITAVFVVIIAAASYYFLNKNKDVKTGTVQIGDLREEMILSGNVTATNYAKMSFETSGKLVYVGVKEGDKVLKGKLLSKLDTTILNSSYQTALANLRIYEATVDNIHNQVKDHSGDETFAQKDLRTTAEATKDKAYEGVIAAKRSLDGASLYAPFNGIITLVQNPFTGTYISSLTPQIEILDPETMYVSATIDQSDIESLVDKVDGEIIFDAYIDKSYAGKILNISYAPKLGESGTVYEVKIGINDIKNIYPKLRVGMTADAKFILNDKKNVLYVSPQYIKEDTKGKYLLIGSNKNKVYVTIGLESDKGTEVLGNIKEGDIIFN
jgi:HlyD family secretion protein